MRNHHNILAALMSKTVARGCTPAEAESARAKAVEYAKRHGLSTDPRPVPRSTAEAWAAARSATDEARRASEQRAAAYARRAAEERAEMERRARAAREATEQALREARAEAERWEAYARGRAEARHAREDAAAARDPIANAQRSWTRLLGLVSHGGLSAAELAVAMGVRPWTVRAMVSRMRKAGIQIESIRYGRETVYRYFPFHQK